MRIVSLGFVALLMIVAVSSLCLAQTQHAFLWTQTGGMQDIGTLPGWDSSTASAISANGQVVGYDRNSKTGQMTAFRWTHNTGQLQIPALGTGNSWANGANALGQVVGAFLDAENQFHAYFWSASTGMIDLGNLGGVGAQAFAINKFGQVVGRCLISL